MPSIVNNVDLLNNYDGNFQCASVRILSLEATPAQEHSAQVAMIETLRTMMGSTVQPADIDNMSNEDFEAWFAQMKAEGVPFARRNVNARVAGLTQEQCDQACNIALNYFEHGYQFIMDGQAPENKLTFTRVGGV